jgi:hypothetical protein
LSDSAGVSHLVEVVVQVEVDVHLGHGLGRLLHLHHVDSEVGEVLPEQRVDHHVVLVGGIAEDVCALGGDGAELDAQHVVLKGRGKREEG